MGEKEGIVTVFQTELREMNPNLRFLTKPSDMELRRQAEPLSGASSAIAKNIDDVGFLTQSWTACPAAQD